MKEKIINENFKITSILARGYYTEYLTASLINQFKNKNVLLWQDMNFYRSCKRFQLSYGVNLTTLLKEFIEEFDVLIIDKLRDGTNVAETIEFMEQISKMEQMKNKQVIIIFSARSVEDMIELEEFPNLKYTIKKYSDDIYRFKRLDKSSVYDPQYKLYNLKTHDLIYLKEVSKGINTSLERINE